MRSIEIKSKQQAAATVAEWRKIDKGFLRGYQTLIIIAIIIISAVLGSRIVFAVSCCAIIADFILFAVRRSQTLRRYNAGTPLLVSSSDFARASEAFAAAGIPEPNMGDWEEAAAQAGHAGWRLDMRYVELIRHYEGGSVADVGCGDGRLLWKYSICPADKYLGLDTGADLVRQLRHKTGASGIVATAEQTALASESIDFISCTEVFEHLPNPRAAVEEFDRILRPGGRAVIQSPNAYRIRNLNPLHVACCIAGFIYPALLMRKIVHENTFMRAYTYHWDFTRQDIKSYLNGSSLRVSKLAAATYRFNPNGSMAHRMAHRMSRLRFIRWAWGDMVLVLDKSAS